MKNKKATARGTAGTPTPQAPTPQVTIFTGFTPADIQWHHAMARQVTLNGLARALPLITNQMRFTAIDKYIQDQPKVIRTVTQPVTKTVTTKRRAPATTRSYGHSPDCDPSFKPLAERWVHDCILKGYGYILLQDAYDYTNATTVAQQNGVRQAMRTLKWDGGKVRAVLAQTNIKGLYKVI